MTNNTRWNAPQACLWIAFRDLERVGKLRENHTFLELAAADDLAWGNTNESDVFPPLTDWIEPAKKVLLDACFKGDISIFGLPSTGDPFEAIPREICGAARFVCDRPERGECLAPLESRPTGLPPRISWSNLQISADAVQNHWKLVETGTLRAASDDRDAPTPDVDPDASITEPLPHELPVVRAKQGRPRTGQDRIREYMKANHPEGTNKTTADLKKELAGAGINYAETTIERAIRRRADGDRSKSRPNR